MVKTATSIIAAAAASDCRLILPVDALVAVEFAANAPHRVVAIEAGQCRRDDSGCRSKSIAAVTAFIKGCRTVVWNGPMGAFETPQHDTGTNAVARAVAAQTVAGDLLSVAGGGDTMAALVNAGSNDQFTPTYQPPAVLFWNGWGKTLPGVEALQVVG